MLSAFAHSSLPPITSATSLRFISVRSKNVRSSTYWYGHVRHSKRLTPSGYSDEGAAREMVSALLQFGQTEKKYSQYIYIYICIHAIRFEIARKLTGQRHGTVLA